MNARLWVKICGMTDTAGIAAAAAAGADAVGFVFYAPAAAAAAIPAASVMPQILTQSRAFMPMRPPPCVRPRAAR